MIVDCATAPPAPPSRYDLCIVGSGPAGLTIARELTGTGLRIAVLESGRRRPTRHADRLRAVESDGIAIKDWSRERVLGGTSTTWAGLSSPLDPIDLAQRPFVRHSGWPIARDELLSLYGEAAARFRFAPLAEFFAERAGAGLAELRTRGDLQPHWTDLEEKVFLAAASPQDFGREHGAVFEGEDADLFLDATVLELVAEPGERCVGRARVLTSRGAAFELESAAFVLAAGGIENARLLLLSRTSCARGLGNERDQVGRYLMNHPKNYHGLLRLAQPVTDAPYFFGCLQRGYAGYAGLRLRESLQRELGLLNAYVRLEPLFPWSDNQGVEALVLLAKRSRFLLDRWKAARSEKVVTLRDYSETGDDSALQNERKGAAEWMRLAGLVVGNALPVARYAWARTAARSAPRVRTVRLRNFLEMEPDRENRVTLGSAHDPYGLPVPRVSHRPTALDRRSLVELHRVLAREVAANGLGTLESDLERHERDGTWPIDQDASHHMGTTRMGNDPATSVVDPDLKVHGIANVFVAGASVFPTSGCANPTFTIVALSIRLARHVRGVALARRTLGAVR